MLAGVSNILCHYTCNEYLVDCITFIQFRPGRPTLCFEDGWVHTECSIDLWQVNHPETRNRICKQGFYATATIIQHSRKPFLRGIDTLPIEASVSLTEWEHIQRPATMNSTACSNMQQMKNRQISAFHLWISVGEAVTNWLLAFYFFLPLSNQQQ